MLRRLLSTGNRRQKVTVLRDPLQRVVLELHVGEIGVREIHVVAFIANFPEMNDLFGVCIRKRPQQRRKSR